MRKDQGERAQEEAASGTRRPRPRARW
jgi:hypothetical protein